MGAELKKDWREEAKAQLQWLMKEIENPEAKGFFCTSCIEDEENVKSATFALGLISGGSVKYAQEGIRRFVMQAIPEGASYAVQ